MSILEKIKSAFGKGSLLQPEQIQRFSRLPKDQAHREFVAVLYDQCVKRATAFVANELKRSDSPFKGMTAADFYHEMLAVTFWILDREVSGGKRSLIDELHDNYFRSHNAPANLREERRKALLEKYERYEDTWNEISGHLDEFGLTVVQNLFGRENSIRTRERTFWIIQYADETAKAFSSLRNVWKRIGSAHAGEGASKRL